MKVTAILSPATLYGEYDNEIDGIELECTRCGHTIEIYGTSEASEKRGCATLNEECPYGESNFYKVD